MKLKYKGNDPKVWKDIVISTKAVCICDDGEKLIVQIHNTVSGLPLRCEYTSLKDFMKDWEDA